MKKSKKKKKRKIGWKEKTQNYANYMKNVTAPYCTAQAVIIMCKVCGQTEE